MSEFLIIFYPDNKTLTVEFYENLESYEKDDYNLASKRSFYLNPFNENKESYEQYQERKVEMSKEVNLYASELAEKNNLKLIPKSFDKHNYLD